MKTNRIFTGAIVFAFLLGAAACKRSNQTAAPTAQSTPNAELKAISERQRQSILRTAETLRKQQQNSPTPTPTTAP